MKLLADVQKKLREKPAVGIGIAAGLFALALLILLLSGGGEEEISHRHWYYDQNTGQLFVTGSREVPPVDAPSGPGPEGEPAGVRAYVFSCSDCDDEASRFIGYLETYTPQDKQRILEGVPPGTEIMAWVRRPGDDRKDWVARYHPKGKAVVREAFARCPAGTRLLQCTP